MFFIKDHSPSYQELTDWSTLKKMITITILVILLLLSLSLSLSLSLFPSCYFPLLLNSVYLGNPSEGQLSIRLFFGPDKVNCNVHETLALTMDQDTETIS